MGERRADRWTRQCGSSGKVCRPLAIEYESSQTENDASRASFQPYPISYSLVPRHLVRGEEHKYRAPGNEAIICTTLHKNWRWDCMALVWIVSGRYNCLSPPGCPGYTLARAGSPDPGGECRAEGGQQHSWNAGLRAHQPATEGFVGLILSLGLLHCELCSISLASCWGDCSSEDEWDGNGYPQERLPGVRKVDNAGSYSLISLQSKMDRPL